MLVLFSSHQQQVARYLGNFLQAFQSFHPPSHCINKPFPFYFTQISSWLWSVLGNPLILLKVHSTKIISKWDKKKKSVIKIRLVSTWTLKRITEKLGLCRVFANQFWNFEFSWESYILKNMKSVKMVIVRVKYLCSTQVKFCWMGGLLGKAIKEYIIVMSYCKWMDSTTWFTNTDLKWTFGTCIVDWINFPAIWSSLMVIDNFVWELHHFPSPEAVVVLW